MRLIRAATRTLEVLEILNQHPSTINELTERTGIARTTILRILRTLIASDYVFKENVRGAKKYFVSPAARRLSCGAKPSYSDFVAVKALLKDLSRDIEWPAYFAINDGIDMEVIESTESDSPFFLRDSILGDRLSLVHSASGLAFLSVCDESTRNKLLDTMTVHIDGPEDYRWIHEKIEHAQSAGCVRMDNCDWRNHNRPISSIAVGLRSADRAFGSVSVRYYAKVNVPENTLDQWSERLVAFASECKRQVGDQARLS